MSAKKILIFSLTYLPRHVGGAEVAIKEITDRIPRDDVEFHMVTLQFDSTLPAIERVGNVLVHRIGFTRRRPPMSDLRKWPLHLNKYFYQALAAWKAHRLHKKHQYDGIWAIMAHSAGVPAVLFKMFHPDVGYVQTLQEGDPPVHVERMARPVWPLFVRAFTMPTVIQTISTFLGVWARRMGATCPVEVIPNGVDVMRFTHRYSTDEITDLQRRMGKVEDDVWLITTSRLVHKNAVDDTLHALALLPARVKFAVVGTGPDEASLKVLASELGISDRVYFAGEVQHSDIPKYLQACDIFIRPSRSEGMGNSFIEAMASGLPIIATEEGGITDFLVDASQPSEKPATGWAVRKNNPEDIARVAQDILVNPEKALEVIKHARELATTAYDWNLIARTMQEKVFSLIPPTS
jgi:glycosyltransferase involved in cell wall biosynthesis